MKPRSWEFIATDESTIIAKPGLDVIVVKDGESDRGFPDPSCANEGDGLQVFGETYELLDQLVASETGPRRRGRRLSRRNAMWVVRLWSVIFATTDLA
jgi:hypothetical protein